MSVIRYKSQVASHNLTMLKVKAKVFLIASLTVFSYELQAQEIMEQQGYEKLVPLVHRFHETSSVQDRILPYQTKQFLIDTLELPFVDDFSLNHQKKYVFYNPALEIDSIYTYFKVNGATPDTFLYVLDTTYYLQFNTGTSEYDTIAHTPLELMLYNNPLDLNNPGDTITVWPAYQYSITGTNDTIDSVLVLQHDTVVNPGHLIFVKDDGYSLWEDSLPHVLVNAQYSEDPVTIGMATFDGVDYNGVPHDNTYANSYDIAEYLTSKPINLDYDPKDSIYLSFYYQQKGLSDRPERDDSLVLEFFSPITQTWYHVWATEGNLDDDLFHEVKLSITDTIFLKNAFQFRFKNYATLSGSYDHWNLDYVRLDRNRTNVGEVLTDIAFYNPLNSFIQDYTRAPWDHYKVSPAGRMISSYNVNLVNLGDAPRFVEKQEDFMDYDGSFLAQNPFHLANPSLNPGVSPTNIAVNSAPVNVQFPANTNASSQFKFKSYLSVTPDANQENDTLFHTQIFDTYYAFDDGSAEAAYILTGSGSKAAQKYTTYVQDTLKGLLFMFPQTSDNMPATDIKIKVWSDIITDQILFQEVVTPAYGSELNGFIRFSLEENPIIVNGDFYIGWENLNSNDVLIGFDRNIDNRSRLYIDYGGGFGNSLLEGTLMMRADFGQANLAVPTAEVSKSASTILDIFPNPVQSILYIKNHESIRDFQILDLMGKQIMSQSSLTDTFIDVSGLAKGLYLVRATVNGQYICAKLIKTE